LPSASGALVSSTVSVHRIPSHVRDDRETPLCWDGMAQVVNLICPTAKAKYFWLGGLDRWNHVDPVRQFAVLAQRPSRNSLTPIARASYIPGSDEAYCPVGRRFLGPDRAQKSRAHSSAGERSLHTGEVQGSIPCAPTIKRPGLLGFSNHPEKSNRQLDTERSAKRARRPVENPWTLFAARSWRPNDTATDRLMRRPSEKTRRRASPAGSLRQ
jgi:hypothetical protein